MVFKNENISEADRERINYNALKDPQTRSRISDLPRWTVDREHDAFMIHIGGGVSREDYHVPHYFLFSWQGMRMRVDAFQNRKPSADPTSTIIIWEVIRLYLPETLSVSREEILQMLTEAFDVYGSTSYSRVAFSAVQVDFSKLEVVQGGVS